MSPSGIRAAGRELDALIAERVFQCAVSTEYPATVLRIPVCIRGAHDCGSQNGVPRYSTDIAAAWEVVENLAKRPGLEAFSCVIGTNGMAPTQNACKFYPAWQGAGHSIVDAEPHDGSCAVATTVPLAICLAALAAVGAEPPEGAPRE